MQLPEVNINDLKPSEYNPRQATEKEYYDLRASIQRFGLVDPIIANSAEARKNIIIGGHFRWRVARELGFKTVPVVYVNIPDIDRERELNIRLNKNLGGWDYDTLANNFEPERLKEWGFTSWELEGLKPDEVLAKEGEGLHDLLESRSDYKQMTLLFHKNDYEFIQRAQKEKGKAFFVNLIVEAARKAAENA